MVYRMKHQQNGRSSWQQIVAGFAFRVRLPASPSLSAPTRVDPIGRACRSPVTIGVDAMMRALLEPRRSIGENRGIGLIWMAMGTASPASRTNFEPSGSYRPSPRGRSEIMVSDISALA